MPVSLGSVANNGQFFNVDEGNCLRWNVIGLGMGQSLIDSVVSAIGAEPSRL